MNISSTSLFNRSYVYISNTLAFSTTTQVPYLDTLQFTLVQQPNSCQALLQLTLVQQPNSCRALLQLTLVQQPNSCQNPLTTYTCATT